MTTTQIETLCNGQVSEAYGNRGMARVVRRDDKAYLILDSWCGGDIEGQCYREFVNILPESLVESCCDAIANAREFVHPDQGMRKWEEWYMSHVNELTDCGRRANLKWAADM